MTQSYAHHQIPLADPTRWSVWREFLLRGAGFPTAMVMRLVSVSAARATDEAARVDRLVVAARDHLLAIAGDALAGCTGDERNDIRDLLQRIRAIKPLRKAPPAGAIADAFAELVAARAEAEAAAGAAVAVFAVESTRIGDELREIARDPAFREALVWQNRNALHGTVDTLLASPAHANDSTTRRRELVVASYVQRYCTKNESIGFFGPWGYGTFRDGGPMLKLQPGATLLARRHVFFEYWAIDQLATHLTQLDGVRPWLPPRLHPAVRIDGTTAIHNDGRRIELTEREAHLLAACTGERPAREIDELGADLARLAEVGLVLWTLEIPTVCWPPSACLEYDRALRAKLVAIGDAEVRARALAPLDQLRDALGRVAAARGEPAALDAAIGALEDTFVDLTGVGPTRHAGKAYAGRNMFFEDCVRDVRIEIGTAVLDTVAAPLAMLLTSARWYTFTVASRYRSMLEAAFAELRRETGETVIEYGRFWERVGGQIFTTGPQPKRDAIVDGIVQTLQARWRVILGLDRVPPTQRTVEVSSAAIRAEVERAFSAPCPGWPTARFHSPDLLVSARGTDAFERGEIMVVLGEIHTGVNTLARSVMHQLHPEVRELVDAIAEDVGVPRIFRQETKDSAMTTRLAHVSYSPRDVQLETGSTPSYRRTADNVRVADLVVEDREGQLVVRTRDGAHVFDVVAFFEEHMRYKSAIHFSVVPPFTADQKHTPRITIDRFILSHERWRFAPDELGFASQAPAFERYRGARAWANAAGLPRFVFAKVPEEKKPIYVDFESPILVELLTKQIRQGSALTVTEMLPGIDECWLVDRAHQTYTSELRICAVDPVMFRAPTREERNTVEWEEPR